MIPYGDPNTLAQRVIEYVSKFDRGFRSRIRPVEDALFEDYLAIGRLKDGGGTLPESYRSFATSMGLDAGGLFKPIKVVSEIEVILQLYKDYEKFEPEAIRSNFPIVAKYTIGDQISLDLSSGPDPQVVETTDFDCAEFLSSSWEHFVLQAAALYVELRRLPRGMWCSRPARPGFSTKETSAALDFVLTRWKLTRSWLSDERHYLAMSQDTGIYADLSLDGSLYLKLFAADEDSMRKLAEEVSITIGAERTGALQRVDGVLCIL